MKPTVFDDIRPYRDAELPEALEDVLEHPRFERVIQFIFPGRDTEEAKAEARAQKHIYDLQRIFTYQAISRLLHDTSNGFTVSGLKELKNDQAYLFISNHRDITLDSALLNYALVDLKVNTVEIGTGNNLFISPYINGLLRLNKSFRIHRKLSPRELQQHSIKLSQYIRQRISQDQHSIWIAQRNGRTKDGHDQADTALLKMLGLSGNDFAPSYKELNIVPLAISYELETCAAFKAEEMYHKQADIPFVKTQEQDLQQMIMGLEAPKGRIHLAVGEVWKTEFEELAEIRNKNHRFQAFTRQLNQQIWKLFMLFPFHYVAADYRSNSTQFASYYTESDQLAFDTYIDQTCQQSKYDKKTLLPFLLDIYAQPVFNKHGLES